MTLSLQSFHKDRMSEDTFLDVARGCYRDTIHFNKFGWNDAIGSSYETIWDGPTESYPYLETASTITVASTSPSDDGGIVEIQGLDENWNLKVLNVNIGSTSTSQWLRVFPEKADIEIQAKAGATTEAGAVFDMLLLKN